MRVSELKLQMDAKFAAVEERFESLHRLIADEAEATRRHVDARVREEGEATRRHFDGVAEKLVAERKLVLDQSIATSQQLVALTASNAADHVVFERRFENHDSRLDKLERARPEPDSP
jgi:hypothetical protein